MLSAKTDSRGYPVCMNRVELASSVDQGWASVNPGLIMRCAVKCGVARVEDFEPAVVESQNLRTVHIDPIIADLVGAGTAPPGSEVQELGCLMGLDAEIEEDLEELESVYAAMEELADMIETGVDAESLDIDHGTVLAQTPVLPEPAPEPVLEVKRRRERRPYSAEQLEVLHNEFHLAA